MQSEMRIPIQIYVVNVKPEDYARMRNREQGCERTRVTDREGRKCFRMEERERDEGMRV